MTSKEALDNLHRCALCYKSSNHDEWINHCRKVRNIVEKDLDRLEKENKELKRLNKNLKNSNTHKDTYASKLKEENERLQKIIKIKEELEDDK